MTTSSASRVFIIHDLGKLNFLAAQAFGQLVPCVQGHVSPTSVGVAISRLQRALSSITSDDYLLAVGHPALIAAAGALQADATGRIRFLCWDNQTQQYAVVDHLLWDDEGGGPQDATNR